jgi:transcriptional regulator
VYIPPHFKEQDLTEIEQLIREFSFATFVSVHENLPWATHIPLELVIDTSGDWFLHGHIARANPQWKNFESADDVLAIFTGPHSYISPSWYDQPNVPTWNYKAVHLYGKVKIVEGEKLENMLQSLMQRHEKMYARQPLEYKDIPAKVLSADLKGLVGFEIKANRIEAVSKLSQNRNAESYGNIISELEQSKDENANRIAEEMKKREK